MCKWRDVVIVQLIADSITLTSQIIIKNKKYTIQAVIGVIYNHVWHTLVVYDSSESNGDASI